MAKRVCSIDGCGRLHDSRGFCKSHAARALRDGLPKIQFANPDESARERLYRIGWTLSNIGCWEFAGSKRRGYGVLSIDAGRMSGAHRVSYEVHIGPIPDGHVVMHSCDNPSCVNPDHLATGTQKQNIADMIAKGRGGLQRHGRPGGPRSTPWTQKLTPDEVRNIRSLRAEGVTAGELADKFHVKTAQIYKIVARQQWKHVA